MVLEENFHADPRVGLILAQDMAGLQAARARRWNLNKRLPDSPWTTELPVTIALENNKHQSLAWLLAQGVQLNDAHSPAIVTACQHSDDFSVIDLLLAHGADLHARDAVGKTALQAALYGERLHFVPLLIARGFDAQTDGSALRQAVSDRQYPAVDALLAAGVDVNFCQPDDVYPSNPSPVLVAAQNEDIALVKKLLAHGANVCQQDLYGERPYTAAVATGNHALADYLKALEPADWHNPAAVLERLTPYNIPPELLSIAQSDQRRMALPGNRRVRHIEFHALPNLRLLQHKGKTLVSLLAHVPNYWALGFLVWNPATQSLGSLDIEHGRYKKLGSVKTFLKDPGAFINKIFA